MFRQIERMLKKFRSVLECVAAFRILRFDANIFDRTSPIRTGFKMMRKLGRYIGKMVGEQALQLLSDA